MNALVFHWGEWTFEPAEWRLSHATAGLVSLPNRTLALLTLLLERAPALVLKDDILSTVWPDAVVEEGNIAFHVAALRKALDAPDQSSCIETVRGRGYRFVTPVTRRICPDVASPTSVAVPTAMPAPAAAVGAPDSAPVKVHRPPRMLIWSVGILAAVIGVATWVSVGQPTQPIHAVTVLPAQLPEGTESAVATELPALLASQIKRRTTLTVSVGSGGTATEDVIQAGQRLHAESVLSIRVNRTGDAWRVLTQLTRTRDQRRLWAWAFDVAANSPTLASAEISARIAAGLGEHLGAMRPRDAAATGVPEAHALVVEARSLWRQRSPADVQRAITLYERAIALDPSQAAAFAGLADAYNLTMSGLTPEVRYPRARDNAERAVALAPDLAAGHTSLAFLRYKFEWRWADADGEFRRAIALDPNYALAHHWYGEFLGVMGRYDEAVTELRRALALEPDSLAIRSDLVPPLLRAGRTAEARAVVEAAARTNPNWHWVPLRLSEVLFAEGRERESLEQRWRWMVLSGASLKSVGELQEAYRTGGASAVLRLEVQRWLAIEAATPGTLLVATNLSRHYARLGDRAEALRWLGIALDRREDAAILLLTNPDYDSLRRDPAFDRLLARVGLKPLP
ncbi:MAG: winged helix-turn-helix domain-containing protein [Acidobacteria bacterium]|nr:winged helix-turn-helix domain-containing protein [Acidobacteriota bacterium]